MNTKKPELMRCPFCGSEDGARLYTPTCDRTTPYDPAHRAFPIVRCRCGVEVAGHDWDHSGESAVDAWNTRHFGRTLTNEIGASTEEAAHEAGQAVIDNESSSIKRDSEDQGGN